ncbi:maleylpyruvate isomerase family mycothiol-dependent enzyme [Aestuariimicrobium ganziense]|uniref:maleylpyruvate isomerase family mycothiol-dependent enzyme n=1 Tax=Aestuariimicrobium ganziense TaxID=2773677 RepID=UPI0019415F23|nr:maleylpyruvate isomerase family mycothiol-dependent enzyme [Aestuariimicrobium ganziense]
MDTDTIWQHIDTQRTALADILEGLTDDQWSRPSLCAEWSVRDVGAHVAGSDVKLHQALIPMVRARFNGDAMIRTMAIASPLSHTQIIQKLRSFSGRRVKPPFVSPMEPLTDALVHTQDVCVPLGIDHKPPHEPLIASLNRTIELNEKGGMALRTPLHGVRLVATDGDWQQGTGQVVEGELRWLLLMLAGRTAAHDHLSGAVDALG